MLTGNGPAAGDTLCERPGGEYRLSGLRRRSDRLGARVAALAEAGEVLVSSTVKDLVNDSGIAFQERGTHVLKGVPGQWELFAPAGHLAPVAHHIPVKRRGFQAFMADRITRRFARLSPSRHRPQLHRGRHPGGGSSPTRPSTASRSRSACPVWRPYSSIRSHSSRRRLACSPSVEEMWTSWSRPPCCRAASASPETVRPRPPRTGKAVPACPRRRT